MKSGNNVYFKLEKEKYFKEDIDILKIFNKDDIVKLNIVNNSFKKNKFTKSIINKGWQYLLEDIKKTNKKNLYNSKLVRLESNNFNLNNNSNTENSKSNAEIKLDISTSITYKDVVGLRYWRYEIYKDLNSNLNPNALSLFNLLITKDNKLVLSLRNCGDFEESYEICGGFIKENEKNSLYVASLNKIKDDYSINFKYVYSQSIKAIYTYKKICESTILIINKLNITMDEFFKLSNNKNLIFFDNNENSILEVLDENKNIVLPSYYLLIVYLKIQFNYKFN